MMKKVFKHIAWMPVLASLLLSWACMKEEFHPEPRPEGALLLHPSVVSMAATKAVNDATTTGVDARAENALGSYLDVFFAGVDTPAFWKEYHLTGRSFTDPAGELISVNWRADGFVAGQRYNVYVVVNGPAAAHSTVGSLSALRAMTHTDNDLYRLKYVSGEDYPDDPSNPNYYYYTNSKSFLMDGVLENWTPTNDHTQTITVNNLKRAAAKIVVNISFKSAFLTELLADNVVPQNAAFKYENFAFCSTVLRSGNTVDPALGTENGKVKFANVNVSDPANEDFHYGIATYSYAFNWTDEALGAPHVLVSIGLKHTGKDGQPVTYHYYRIPVRPQGQTSLQRNSLYIVNAQLDNKGSYTEDDATIPVNLSYQVLEWTAESSEITNVKTDEVHYFIVNPKEIALHGDGAQSVTLRYHAPENAAITIEAIPTAELDAEATARSFTTPTPQTVGGHGYQALYIDKDGNPQASSVDGITVNTTAGTITVTSTALANRASKYIRFRAVYTYTENSVKKHINQDIYIRHFPVDYIENIEGWYSYKYNGATLRQYSFTPTADGWDSWAGYEDIECNSTEYSSAETQISVEEAPTGTYNNYDRRSDIVSIERSEFVAAINNLSDRTAIHDNGSNEAAAKQNGDWWYWGEGDERTDITIWSQVDDYDWSVTVVFVTGYHVFKNYYKRQYFQNTYVARRYYRDVPNYAWVRWEYDSETRYSTSKTVEDNFMKAKVYEGGTMYSIKETSSGGTYIAETDQSFTWNNRAYIIQITQSDDAYTLGRPVVDGNGFSQDQVVSPAFMIASQLGAMTIKVPPLTAAQSVSHCRDYVEVSTDGTIYDNWRLPTKAECEIIKRYQGTDVMRSILTSRYYFALNGGSTVADYFDVGPDKSTGPFARCVRDLTAAEVERMNRIK